MEMTILLDGKCVICNGHAKRIGMYSDDTMDCAEFSCEDCGADYYCKVYKRIKLHDNVIAEIIFPSCLPSDKIKNDPIQTLECIVPIKKYGEDNVNNVEPDRQ